MEGANQLKAQGKDVLIMAAGEPDFPTPSWICEGAYEAIKQGQTRYTAVDGTPALKKAICAKLMRDHDLDYEPYNISVGTGAKQVIYNALVATLNPEDEVIIPTPYWVSYPDMVLLAGGKPVIVEGDAHFKLLPEVLEEAITPNTKWLILNSPNNPSGAVHTKDELMALGQVLLKHPHVHVISDDIYEKMVYGVPFFTLAQVVPELKDRVLTINGVSKAYAMTGWRLGYGAGARSLIQGMATLQSQSTSNPSSISQAAALVALEGPQDFLEEWCSDYQARRDMFVRGINGIRGLSCPVPDGAFYVFPTMRELIGLKTPTGVEITDDLVFCEYLLNMVGLACVPGGAFGSPTHFRMSYPYKAEVLKDALNRLEAAINKLW